ncbi:Fc.00g011930.m01.CDS01 [Cosmosporella sp. VM-42]
MPQPLQKVCLVGANGTLGSVLLTVLLASPFTISILKRTSSKSHTPPWATEIPIPDDLPLESLTEALRGQDAVIAAFPLRDVSQHLRLVEASLRAGVKRFIPADFGSCDANTDEAKSLKLYRDKNMVREKCEKLASHNEDFSYTALVCGHFFDFGLRGGLLHFNLDTQTAQILDDGNIPASASTLRRVGEGVVAILSKPAETRNRTIYIQSFCHSQLEVLAALEKVTGTKWKTEKLESGPYLEEQRKKFAAGDHEAIEDIVFVLGTLNADWRTRDGFAMEELGLQDEKLDDVVADVLAAHTAQKA